MLRLVGERLRSTAARHPGRAVGVLAAIAVLGTALAGGWTERLALSSNATRQAPLQIRVTGALPAGSGAFRVAVRTMRSQLAANPAVAAVHERRIEGQPRATVLVVRFEVGGRRRDAAIARIESSLDPGPLQLSFRGEAAAARAAKDAAIDDLYLLLASLPAIALLAVALLGLRAGGTALLAAAAAAALSALLSELAAGAFDVSWLALAGAAAGGSLVTLQLCAMARADAGSAPICAAALAAAVPFAATALLGVDYLAGLGLGGALGALLAAPAALLAAGAGEGFAEAQALDAEDADVPADPRGAGAWSEVGDLLGWSAPIAALIGLVALALLAFSIAPVDGLALAALGATAAPAIGAAQLAAATGAALVATAAIAGYCGRRIGLAIAGTFAFALPAAAVAGLLVASIQAGWLESTLDYVSTGALQLGSVATAVAVVASVSASQLVALAAAASEARSPERAGRVEEALAAAGPAMTLVCLAGVAAGVALAFSSSLFIKELGLGLAAGMALELAVVGVLLAPGLLRLSPDRASRQ